MIRAASPIGFSQIGFNSAMNLKQAFWLAKETASSWSDDYAPSMGAALAYYTLFSVAPLFLIVVSIAGLIFGEEAARGHIYGELQELMGRQGALAVQSLLKSVNEPASGVLATLFGTAVLFIGATGVFGELQDALDRIWRSPAKPGGSTWKAMLRGRLLSFAMVLGIGFLLIVSLLASAGFAALGKWWAPAFGDFAAFAEVVNLVLTFALLTASFAMVYKTLPRVRIQWRDVWIGATVTAVLFTLGKFLIGLYLGRATFASGFGAAGSLVVLLVWVYYSAQIFLLGAEFTWVYAHGFGSMRAQKRSTPAPAVPSRTDEDPVAALARSRAEADVEDAAPTR
jgi:membrane protein